MKQTIKRVINLSSLLVFALICAVILGIGCNKPDEEKEVTNPNVLKIYNWQDYIDEGLNDDGEKVDPSVMELWEADYERRHNVDITVQYDTFETNETMLNTLKTEKTQYDLICPSDYIIQKMIKEDMLEKFDAGALSTYDANVSPYLKDLFAENGWTDYAACYMWGTLGIIYNTEHIDPADVEHWSGMWNEKYQNKVSAKDSVRDTYCAGVMYVFQEELMGYRDQHASGTLTTEEYNAKINEVMNRHDKDTIEKVEDALKAMKKNIFGYEVDSGKSDIVTGKIYMNLAWSGDAVYSMDLAEEEGIELAYSVPLEGSNVWFDGWCMPKGANKALAQDFINFISQPEIARLNMDTIGYTTAIVGNDIFDLINEWYGSEDPDAVAWDITYLFGNSVTDTADTVRLTDGKVIIMTDEVTRQLYAQYPNEETVDRCGVMQDFGESNESILKMWSRIKSNAISPILIVVICVISAAAVGGIVYIIIRNKKKQARRNRKKSA